MPITTFKPSVNGFHFGNTFSSDDIMSELLSIPAWLLFMNSITAIPMWAVWNKNWGLCGGMSFAALDRFFSLKPIPDLTSPPSGGSTLFKELVSRQMDALRCVGIENIFDYQTRPDEGHWHDRHSVGHYTQTRQWPSVKNKLDSGIPTTICIIREEGWDFWNIGKNHMAVAYDYWMNSSKVTLKIYDSYHPNRDDVEIGFTLGQEHSRLDAYQNTGERVRGFLHVPYDRTERLITQAQATPKIEEDNLEWLWTVLQ